MPPDEFEFACWSPIESSAEAAAGVLPGNELNSSTVNLLKTAIDLFAPGFFRAFVNHLIKALDQRSDQRGASLSGKP
jgi:hypothetical protein